MIKEFEIIKCTVDNTFETIDKVVTEVPLTIVINNIEYITIMCTPLYMEELAIGFLFNEGILKSKEDIKYSILDKNRVITSGSKGSLYFKSMDFMKEKKFDNNIKIHKNEIMNTMKEFFNKSKIFEETGGVHSVLLKSKEIEVFREDIGRHNAIDKAVGYLILNNLNVRDFIIYVSGRLSSEMVSKISKSGICFAISRACPTSLSLNLARNMNMTLIGFSRGNRFNVYSGSERIDFND